MAKFGIAPGPSGSRRRIATAFAAAGALLLSSGLVIAAAAPATANHGSPHNQGGGNQGNGNQGNGNQGGGGIAGGNRGSDSGASVTICHRRGGDKNPYGVMSVAPNSTVLAAHRDHQIDDGTPGEDKYWKFAGTWNGTPHNAGDFKPDYILDATATEEAVAEFIEWCLNEGESGDNGNTAGLAPLDWAPNSCQQQGYVREPQSAGVEYTIDGGENWAVTSGSYLVRASIINGATGFTGSTTGWTVTDTTATRTIDLGSAVQCVDLDVTADAIDACGDWGSVTAADTDLVDYSIADNKWSDLEGDVVVTATLRGGATAFSNTAGWTVNQDGSATRTFQLGSYTECSKKDDDPKDKLVTPRRPSATDATCSRDGRLVVPNQPSGVQVKRSGSVPGDVTFTFSPAEGYAFPAGTKTTVTVTVPAQLEGDDCILGVETNLPKPGTKNPGNGPAAAPANNGTDAEVLGEQAVAVPTAVAAGLGDTMTATSTTSRPLLAQALVAAGLLMLVAGGATGLGRRTRGAHES